MTTTGAAIEARDLAIARPSLDDVYLRHTARSFTRVAEEVAR